MKQIYLIKKLYLANKKYESLDVKAFIDDKSALKYIDNEIEKCKKESSKYKGFSVWDEGFKTSVFNYYGTHDIHFDAELMSIGDEVPDEIYVYTEVNTYDSGEICPHAIGCLTKEDAIKELVKEVEYRDDEECENHYWISDGDVEDGYVELEDEYKNISYLAYEKIKVQK